MTAERDAVYGVEKPKRDRGLRGEVLAAEIWSRYVEVV